MSDFEERYQKKHKTISVIKSSMRIGAAVASIGMILFGLPTTAILFGFLVSFIFAELLGIWEEMI